MSHATVLTIVSAAAWLAILALWRRLDTDDAATDDPTAEVLAVGAGQ